MTPTVTKTGNLRITTYENGQKFVILTACPFCGYQFDENEERSDHFYDHHTPGDAGLTPYTQHEKQTTIGDYHAELVTDGGRDPKPRPRNAVWKALFNQSNADFARNDLEIALDRLERLGDDHDRVRYHVREALQCLTAAEEGQR